MKVRTSVAASALLLLFGVGVAAAQTIEITPEQETVIREYVTTQEVQPVEVPPDVTIEVGSTLPDTIELHALETPDVEVSQQYVVVDGRTVLVEPETREIIHIIE